MKLAEFDERLRQYAKEKFIPALSNPVSRFILGAGVGAGTLGVSALGGESLMKAVNALAEDGTVDTAALRKALCAGFDATADGKLPVHRFGLALSLDKGDAEAFFAWLEPTPAPTATAA